MTQLIFIGGFLGAGKTTLIYEISKILKQKELTFGLITNDQVPDLADTSLLKKESLNIAEVSGSCFCCDFKALRKAIGKVSKNRKTDLILAEPVGSCTDLSATLIHPLREMMQTEVTVAPLTVLIDPGRLREIIDDTSTLHPAAAYIIRKQLEESDIIGLTKTDLYTPDEIALLLQQIRSNFPECSVHALSSTTGDGLVSWLDEVLHSTKAGKQILELDYDRYAEGEAVLGWLNCSATLNGRDMDWDLFARSLMIDMSARFEERNIQVGHVKIMLENGDRYLTANLTGGKETLNYRWSAGKGNQATLIVNARVETSPEKLKEIFISCMQEQTSEIMEVNIHHLRCIQPGYPRPTYRYKPSAEKI